MPNNKPGKTKKIRASHRIQLNNRLCEAEAIVIEAGESNTSDIKYLISVIETKIKKLEELDDDVISASSEIQFEDEMADIEDVTPQYHARLSHLLQFQSSRVPPAQTPQTPQTTPTPTATTTTNNYKLQRLSLKKFGGNQLDWLSFEEDFSASIDGDQQLPAVTKFRYLLSCLQGEAFRAVSGIPVTAAGYSLALGTLRVRYGDEERNIEAYMSAILATTPPKNEHASLLQFADTVETYIRALMAMGKTEEGIGDLLLPIMKNKLPGTVRTQLCRTRGSDKWTFAKFREALFTEIKALREGTATETSLADSLVATAAFAVTNSNTRFKRSPSPSRRPQRVCPYCKSDTHRASECTTVPDHSARRDILMKDRLCLNCTGPHMSYDCQSTYGCNVCSSAHHTSIHDIYAGAPPSSLPSRPYLRGRSPSPQSRPAARPTSPFPRNPYERGTSPSTHVNKVSVTDQQ